MNDEDRFIIGRWAYSIGEEFISDIEYDRLEREMKSRGVLKEYINRGWSEDPCPYELLRENNLDEFIVPVIYTHNTESIESLNSIDAVREKCIHLSESSRLSYKMDGYSVRLNYFDGRLILALTRNRNGGKAKNLDKILPLFKQNISLKGKVLINGELFLKTSKLNEYKTLRGIISQRNGVSTAIANGDIEFLDYKCYNIYSDDESINKGDKYKILLSLGFSVPRNVIVKDYNSMLVGVELLSKTSNMFNAPTDGVVLENSTMQYALRINNWKEECKESYIKGYIFNRGMYGNSISVEIAPIHLENKVQRFIDVTNIQTIIDYNLRIGAPIAFVERSAVNSVLDTSRTQELHEEYEGRYSEFINKIDSLERR